MNELQKIWLRVKSQIVYLEPKKKEQIPKHCLRQIAYRISTHPCYTGYRLISFILYLVASSLYHTNMN